MQHLSHPSRRLGGRIAVALLITGLLGTTGGCNLGGTTDDNPQASPTIGTQDPSYNPTLPAVPFTYQLSHVKPDQYEVMLLNGWLHLRQGDQPVAVNFRVDKQHPDTSLVTQNLERAKKLGWKTEPVAVDGGKGYRTRYVDDAITYEFVFFAKDATSVTIGASLGKDANDRPAKQAIDEFIASFRWNTDGMSGNYTDAHPVPKVPFSYKMPDLFRDTKPQVMWTDFWASLMFGDDADARTTLVNVSRFPNDDAAIKSFEGQKAKLAGANIHPNDMKSLGVTADGLGKQINEGYSLNLTGVDGQPQLVAFHFRKDSYIYTLSANSRGDLNRHALDAMRAPLDMVNSWMFHQS